MFGSIQISMIDAMGLNEIDEALLIGVILEWAQAAYAIQMLHDSWTDDLLWRPSLVEAIG